MQLDKAFLNNYEHQYHFALHTIYTRKEQLGGEEEDDDEHKGS